MPPQPGHSNSFSYESTQMNIGIIELIQRSFALFSHEEMWYSSTEATLWLGSIISILFSIKVIFEWPFPLCYIQRPVIRPWVVDCAFVRQISLISFD